MKNKIETDGFDENQGLVPDDDLEFEKKLADDEREKREAAEQKIAQAAEERRRREREAAKARERRIAQDKLDLLKMKEGIADEDEEIKEEHTEKRELKGFEKISNIWYHDKMWICFGVFIAAVVGFLVYDTLSRVQPDITVMLICDNVLQSDESRSLLAEKLEQYTPDLNGDGEVKVTVMNCALNDYKSDTLYTTNSQKFYANLQQGSVIMVITDSNTDPDYQALMADNLTEELPDNPYIDEDGLSLNFGFLASELNCENLPNDIHLCLRRPVATLDNTLEEMQENYDTNLAIFKDFANALAEQAEQEGDTGLKTEPTPIDGSAAVTSTADSKSEEKQDESAD